MTAVRRTLSVRLTLMMGVAVGSLATMPAHAQNASRGYPVGSSASAVAAQTFTGGRSGVSPNPAGGTAPNPMAPSLGGPPVIAPPVAAVVTGPRTQEQIDREDDAREAAERRAELDDGLGPDGFYLEADLVVRDDKAKTIVATGGVESRYGGRTLRANQVTYDQTTGIITAKGAAQLIDEDGNVEFADELVLDDAKSTGFARNFSARMADKTTMAASTAVRRSAQINELNNALYTPCPLCAEDPSKPPSWSFRAEKVIDDKNKQVVYFRKAKFYLWAVPAFYLPVFWTTSPSAVRSSGFLTPKITLSKRRGLSYEQPYLQLLGPSSDIILSPQVNTGVNPFLNFNYRQRFYSGTAEFRGGVGYDQDFDNHGEKFGDSTFRSYVLAKGRFDINDKWLWGFSAERASEDLVLDKYDINDIYLEEARGLFPDQERRFSSQLYTIRQDARSFLSISAVTVQGLIPARDGSDGDNDRTFPLIAPLVEARWDPKTPILGGRLRLRGQSVVLNRTQSDTISPTTAVPRPAGIDSRRASGEFDWRANYTTGFGFRLSPFAQGRSTAYDISDLPGDETKRTVTTNGVVGADFSLPVARRVFRGALVLEPLAQIAISPEGKGAVIGTKSDGSPIYFNEDGVSFEFEETNLLRPNKFPGFDLYEGGKRVNVAARASYITDSGLTSMLFVGRSFRDTVDPIIPTRSGLATKSSDWIVAAQIQPMEGLSLMTRTRLDSETHKVRRIESGLEISNKYGVGNVAYKRDELDINGEKIQSFNASLRLNVTEHWQVGFRGDRSIEEQFWKQREFGVIYRDDCLAIEFLYQREDQFVNTPTGAQIRPASSFLIRLNLATLGDTGYSQ